MTVFTLVAGLTTLTARFARANYRFIRLPTTIGLMVLAAVADLLAITSTVGCFSIIVQGLTVGTVTERLLRRARASS